MLEVDQGANSGAVTFEGSTGTLRLDDAPAFQDSIVGFSGNGTLAGSDQIDLTDINFNSVHFGAVYSSTNDVLTVTDGTDGTNTANLQFVGSYIQSDFQFTSDGNGGTLLYDPPAADAATSVTSSATDSGISGDVTFADSGNDAQTASFTADGANYLGSFSLGSVTESSGTTAVGFDFMADNDQINLASGQTVTQSYDVTVADAQNPAENVNQTISVTIGGPGNDNFVFTPGVGADTITNFNPQQDKIELDHFANVQTVQELQALITADVHGDAVINLGHNDSITLSGVTDTQLQQVIHAGHVLLH